MGFGLADIPVVGGMFDKSSDQAMDQDRSGLGAFSGIQIPEFQDYKPEDEQYAGDYDPTKANANTISEDPALRSQQLGYLAKLAGLADTGLTDVDQAGYERARELGDQTLRSGTDAALANAEARNARGSGLEFAMREMASQQGAGNAQNAGLQQAADAARNRMLYEQAYGQGVGNLRSQDLGVNEANADILNKFNMYNTTNQNQANQRNIDTRQNISNTNVGQHNFAQQYNNNLKQLAFGDQIEKAGGVAKQYNNLSDDYYSQNAANAANRNALTGTIFQGASYFGNKAKKNAQDNGAMMSDNDMQSAGGAALA